MLYTSKPDLTTKSQMDYFQKTFYYLYILVVAINFSPSKLLGYFTPLIFVGGIFLIWPSEKLFRKLFIVLLLSGIIITFYGLIFPYVVVQNACLMLITYSSFITIIVLPAGMLVSEILFHKILAFNQKLLLIEGSIGIIQAVYGFTVNKTFRGSNGDIVKGTISPTLFSFDSSIGSRIFSINMCFLCLLALVAVLRFRYRPYPLIVAFTSILLACVVHINMFLIAAGLVTIFINFAHFIKKQPKLLIILLAFTGLALSILFSLKVNMPQLTEQVTFEATSYGGFQPKIIITNEAFSVIPKEYPAMPFIGLGPGQFSSKASLIGSGHYFGGFYNPQHIPLLTPKTSAPMEKLLMPLWAASADPHLVLSSSMEPFYSWLSIYTEFGLVGSFIVISIVAFFLIKAKSLQRINSENLLDNFIFQIGVLFLFFLGYQETYWETPQAIFIGLILLKLLYAKLIYSK